MPYLPHEFKPYAYFQDYLRYGCYPFFQNDKDGYHQRLGQLIRTIVEYDMAEILFTLSENTPSLGTVREVFFNNQLSVLHKVHQAATTDFVVDNQYYFEIGGKRKTSKQIKDLDNAWIVKDELEYPILNSLPLWLFGFLY